MKGSVVKKGSNWFCVYRVNGKQKWVQGGANKKQAEKKLTKIINEVNEGTYKELKASSFADFARNWLKIYGNPNLKASTYKSYVDIIENHLIPQFGGSGIANISPADLQEYVSLKLEDGKSPKTVNNHLVPLKKMLKHAVVWGYLKQDPSLYIEKPRVEKEEMDFLAPGEIRLFLNEVNQKHYALFMAAIYTGLRRGELLALQWGDIEFHSNNISVRRSLYKGQFISPKSKKSFRKIIMSPDLAAVLKKHKFLAAPNDADLVFANEVGKPMDPDTLIKRHFKPALRRAKLREVRFHDLRHTYATLLISNGENIKFIQRQLGHASIQTTLDRYGHLLPEVSEGVGARLDKIVGMGKTVDEKIGNQSLKTTGTC